MTSSEKPSGLLTVPAACKFCQKPRDLSIDPAGAGSPMFDIEALIKLAACNRCADFFTRVGTIGEAIGALAQESLRLKTDDAKASNRESLVALTQGFAQVVCDHYHKIYTWEPDFVEQILEQPHKFSVILKLYRRGVAQ